MFEPDHSTAAGPLGRAALAECPHCGTRVLPLPGRYCPACRRDLDAAPDRAVVVESDEVLAAGRKLARRLLRGHLSAAEVGQNLVDRGIHADSVARIVREAGVEQVEWYRARSRRAIEFGLHCGLVATLFALAALIIWRDPRNHLLLPATLALAISAGMIYLGVNLKRRAAAVATPPTMKSRPGPVDIRRDYLD